MATKKQSVISNEKIGELVLSSVEEIISDQIEQYLDRAMIQKRIKAVIEKKVNDEFFDDIISTYIEDNIKDCIDNQNDRLEDILLDHIDKNKKHYDEKFKALFDDVIKMQKVKELLTKSIMNYFENFEETCVYENMIERIFDNYNFDIAIKGNDKNVKSKK